MNLAAGLSIAFFILIAVIFLRKPLFYIIKWCISGIFGIITLLAANSFIPGMSVGINPYTATISAIFGIPGAALMCILEKIL